MKAITTALLVITLTGCATAQDRQEARELAIAEAAAWCGEFYTTDQELQDCTIRRYQHVEAEEAAYNQRMGAAISQGFQHYSNVQAAQRNAYLSRGR